MPSLGSVVAPHGRRIAVLIVLGLVVGAVSAWAIWSAGATSTSHGAATAATVNQGATPTASASPGRSVAVTWGASTLSNGHAVDGYAVTRYDATSGAAQTTLAGCSGTISATSCTETGVPPGQWKYTVTPVIAANWRGAESLKSGSATVAAATLTLAKTLFGAPLPQSTTGSLTGFAALEGVTYRLDSATALTGSPASVSAAGTATISSLTIPSTTDGPHTVWAFGDAAPFASQASLGIVTDTTAPTASAQLTPAANAAGWNNTAPVAVALSATDGSGSGVHQIRYTTDGTDPTTSGTAQVYASALSIAANTTIRYYATDNAGNASAAQTQLVKIDTLAPTNVLTLSSATGAYLSAGTVYYRGSSPGSFTLTNALTDTGGSGAASSGTAALVGTSTGFAHTSSLATTPAGGPYVSNPFTWSAGTASSPTESVTGSDVAANSSTTVLTFTNDSTTPTGGSVDATGLGGTASRYASSLTLHAGFAKGSDSGSGLAATGSQLLRATAALTSAGTADGACGPYGSYAQVGSNDPTSPVTDLVPTDNQCYRYEYLVPDNVGNVAVYVSPDIKVETTAPGSLSPTAGLITAVTGPVAQFESGASVYYNPALSGSFTVDSSASDAHSGIAQLAFPTLGGFTGGGSVTTPNTGTTFRTTYAWSGNGASPSPGAQSLTATANAGRTATTAAAFSVIADAVSPAGGTVDASGLVGTGGRYATSTTLSVAFAKGSDGGSGLAATGAQLLRASATLSSTGGSNGTCGTYGAFAQVGANDPSSPKADTVPSDHTCYRYEYVVADNVGNSTTYTSPDIKVDTTAPAAPSLGFSAFANTSHTGSAVYYRPGAGSGAVTVTATAADAVAGIASYAFPTLGSGWTAAAGALGVETYSYTAAPTPPSGSQNVTATNNAGLQSPAGAFTVVADSTAPSGGSVAYTPGYYTSASVSVSFSAGTDAGSGVDAASGLLQQAVAPLSGGSCGTFGSFATIAANPASPYLDTSGASGNCYEYRYLVSDAVGNQSTYTSGSVVKLDTQAPTQTFSLANPIGAALTGSTLYYKGNAIGSFKLVDTLVDAASGVASATFPPIATTGWTHLTETQLGGGPFTSTTFSWTANPTNPTGYAVSGADAAGNTGASQVTFVSDTTPPSTGSVGYTAGVYDTLSVPITTTNGTDAQSGVNAASGVIKRDVATLTPLTETCGSFPGTYATTVTLVSGNDTSVTTGHCYKYEYLVSDNVGNQATYTSANVAQVDTTGPQVTAIVSQDHGGTPGKLEVTDKLIITFNKSLLPATVPATVSGSETRAATLGIVLTPNVQLTIPNLSAGTADTGSPDYVVSCLALCAQRTVNFAATVALLNNGTATTVTLTVTSVSGDTPFASSGTLAFTPAATITDDGSNAATGSFSTASNFRLF